MITRSWAHNVVDHPTHFKFLLKCLGSDWSCATSSLGSSELRTLLDMRIWPFITLGHRYSVATYLLCLICVWELYDLPDYFSNFMKVSFLLQHLVNPSSHQGSASPEVADWVCDLGKSRALRWEDEWTQNQWDGTALNDGPLLEDMSG